jgi:hypothetical protein
MNPFAKTVFTSLTLLMFLAGAPGADSLNVRCLGFLDTPDFARSVAATKEYAFVADHCGGLRAIDVRDPWNPQEVGYYFTGNATAGVKLQDTLAYLAEIEGALWGHFRVIGISDPANLYQVGECGLSGMGRGVACAGHFAFVSDGGSGLQVIDVSDPALPRIVGNSPTTGWFVGVAYADSLAFVAAYDGGVRVVDVSQPADPREVGSSPGEWVFGVAVSGSYVYLADSTAGLRVVDVSNPAQPREVGRLIVQGEPHGVAVRDSLAYVASGSRGLRVVDVRDPAWPKEVGFYDTPGYSMGVWLAGNYIYVADGLAGLIILEYYGATGASEDKEPARGKDSGVTVHPNPMRESCTIRWEGKRTCRIYDLTGRRVRELWGLGGVRWDGRDEARARVRAGIYFVGIDGFQISKLVMLRR